MVTSSFTRRQAIQLISAASLVTSAKAAPAPMVAKVATTTTALKPATLGLCGPTYYNGYSPFLNWWKTANTPTIGRTLGDLAGTAIWSTGIYLSPVTGEIVSPAPADLLNIRRIFFAPPSSSIQVAAGCDYSGETWIAEWDGSAVGYIDFLTAGGSQTAVGSNKITFQMGARPGNTQLRLTLKDRSNPPHNIRIYQQRYATNVAAGETFNPDWLGTIKNFDTLRLMDWQATNNSDVMNFSQLADESYSAWCQPLKSSFGAKGGIHPWLLCKLANQTGHRIHVCLPAKCTDAFVQEFATYMKANTKVEVTYEYSNECWNFGFQQASYCLDQGSAIWPNNGARYNMWYGYRAAEIMKIIRGIYNDASRWQGCINTQTVTTGPLSQQLAGVAYSLRSTPTLHVNDLFKGVYATGYFGDLQSSKAITSISRTNPAFVQCKAHGYKEGQRIKIFVQNGMKELDNVFAAVTNASTDSFELKGVDATNFSLYVSGNNYAVPALIFDIMDRSSAKFAADSITYPTKYTYFSQQLAASMLNGTCSEGLTTIVNVSSLKTTYWPALKTLASANGLELRQYEGGSHFVGDIYLNGYGGQPQFTEFLVNSGHSAEIGAVYAAAYAAFLAVGGTRPAKFVEGGLTSQFGTWAGIRYWPTAGNSNKIDNANPVWKATINFIGTT